MDHDSSSKYIEFGSRSFEPEHLSFYTKFPSLRNNIAIILIPTAVTLVNMKETIIGDIRTSDHDAHYAAAKVERV
jgi:hypothetical protein